MSGGALGRGVDVRVLFDSLDGVALWTSSEFGAFDYVSSGIEDI